MSTKTAFYTFKQGNKMSIQRYYELFLSQVTVLQEVGITMSNDAIAFKIASKKSHEIAKPEDYTKACKWATAICFIQGVNPRYSAQYLMHLRNIHLEGNDYYPWTLTEAYHTLSHHETS